MWAWQRLDKQTVLRAQLCCPTGAEPPTPSIPSEGVKASRCRTQRPTLLLRGWKTPHLHPKQSSRRGSEPHSQPRLEAVGFLRSASGRPSRRGDLRTLAGSVPKTKQEMPAKLSTQRSLPNTFLTRRERVSGAKYHR